MHSFEPPSTLEQLLSLKCKLTVFAAGIRHRNPESVKAQLLEREAAATPEKGLLSRLRRWSKEVDTWIRETMEPAEQERVAQQMKHAGVLKQHLPRVWSVAAAKRILKRGTIRDQADLSVVRVTLDAEGHGHLSNEELADLGRMFDKFTFVPETPAQTERPGIDA